MKKRKKEKKKKRKKEKKKKEKLKKFSQSEGNNRGKQPNTFAMQLFWICIANLLCQNF